MPNDTTSERTAIANAFDRDVDPLADLATTFDELDVDPFDIFRANVLETDELADNTLKDYDRVYANWRRFMVKQGRHPACPSEDHVLSYIRDRLNAGDKPVTVKRKLNVLDRAYEFWQQDAVFPHPTDYDPFTAALEKASFPSTNKKDYPRISLEDLREKISQVTHHRDRAIIVLQLKLGLRAGEVTNIRLSDLNLTHPELREYYPSLGTAEPVAERENALYIPPSRNAVVPVQGREGNKSKRPRVLPLDDESREVLVRYLLVRPTVDESAVFLTKERFNPLNRKDPLHVWQDAFHPEYAATDLHRAVTPHFGRHWFTTYWQVHEDLNPELVVYMRGDKPGSSVESKGAIQHYIHTYYEDIADLYRDRIFKLLL